MIKINWIKLDLSGKIPYIATSFSEPLSRPNWHMSTKIIPGIFS